VLDIKFIRENKELVKEAAKLKGVDFDVDKLLSLDEKRLELLQEIEELRRQRNETAEKMKSKELSSTEREKLIEKGKSLKEKINELEEKYRPINEEYENLILISPNIPSDDTPRGKTAEDNVVVETWGEPVKFDFPVKSHIELGKSLDLVDTETGANVSGYRGYYLKNEAAILQLGLMLYALQKLIDKGFTPMIVPTLVKEFALIGSGHFPLGKEEIYQIGNPDKLADGSTAESLFLVGTAEPSLLAYNANKIYEEKDLPIKLCGFSPCYRSEIGSYGKDTQGLYRLHEFMKVEQVIICRADVEESDQWLEVMRGIAQEILRDLELPHRVVAVCAGDMGLGKRKMYDIETWMPSRQAYGETHSDSNLTDWQTRRLNIKYRNLRGEIKYAYALNNTALASPRILIPLLEYHQRADGSIKIPQVLHKYVGFEAIGSKKK